MSNALADGYEKKSNDLDRKPSPDNDSALTERELEEIEPATDPDLEYGVATEEKIPPKASSDSKRPGLSRIASHITTHSITDPGPPPDGGLKAWTQVAMSWLAVLSTWGWVNCFGKSDVVLYFQSFNHRS